MHVITNNIALNALDITVSGFWTLEHLDDFARDLAAAIAAFPRTGKPPASIYNFTEASIQTQAVIHRMQHMASSPEFAGRRVALYTEGCLARFQAKRVAEAGALMRVFQSRAEAVAWVTADPATEVIAA